MRALHTTHTDDTSSLDNWLLRQRTTLRMNGDELKKSMQADFTWL